MKPQDRDAVAAELATATAANTATAKKVEELLEAKKAELLAEVENQRKNIVKTIFTKQLSECSTTKLVNFIKDGKYSKEVINKLNKRAKAIEIQIAALENDLKNLYLNHIVETMDAIYPTDDDKYAGMAVLSIPSSVVRQRKRELKKQKQEAKISEIVGEETEEPQTAETEDNGEGQEI